MLRAHAPCHALSLALILILGPVAGKAQQDRSPAGEQAQQGQAQPGPQTQRPPPGQLRSPVLTIDTERLFNDSRFGQRVLQEIVAGTEALATENRRIEAELIEEERDLARRRPTMAPEMFRTEAEAFDTRVQEIRRVQDAKQRAFQDALAEGRETFLAAIGPVLGNLMRESGAAVILDRRSVFAGIGLIDVTDEAIAEIDAAIGDGTRLSVPAADAGDLNGGQGAPTLRDIMSPGAARDGVNDTVLPGPGGTDAAPAAD